MVDQLWLWYIKSETGSGPDTVITSFPSRKGVETTSPRDADDLQGNVLKDKIFERQSFCHGFDLENHDSLLQNS
jgi:hypothetical protein